MRQYLFLTWGLLGVLTLCGCESGKMTRAVFHLRSDSLPSLERIECHLAETENGEGIHTNLIPQEGMALLRETGLQSGLHSDSIVQEQGGQTSHQKVEPQGTRFELLTRGANADWKRLCAKTIFPLPQGSAEIHPSGNGPVESAQCYQLQITVPSSVGQSGYLLRATGEDESGEFIECYGVWRFSGSFSMLVAAENLCGFDRFQIYRQEGARLVLLAEERVQILPKAKQAGVIPKQTVLGHDGVASMVTRVTQTVLEKGYYRQTPFNAQRWAELLGRELYPEPLPTEKLQRLTTGLTGAEPLLLKGEWEKIIAGTLPELNQVQSISPKRAFGALLNSWLKMRDPFASWESPEIAHNQSLLLDGKYFGLGLRWRETELSQGHFVVGTVFPQGPSAKSGLKQGEIVTSIVVDDERLDLARPAGVEELSAQIEKSKHVQLTIKGRSAPISITPAEFKLPEMQPELTTWEGLPCLRLPEFNQSSATVFLGLLAQVKGKQLVLDLRGNHGGVTSEAQKILGYLIGHAPLPVDWSYRDDWGRERHFRLTVPTDQKWSGELTVLVDRTSASAAELTVMALRPYARILGEPTFGKHSSQEVIRLPDGSRFRYTVALFNPVAL